MLRRLAEDAVRLHSQYLQRRQFLPDPRFHEADISTGERGNDSAFHAILRRPSAIAGLDFRAKGCSSRPMSVSGLRSTLVSLAAVASLTISWSCRRGASVTRPATVTSVASIAPPPSTSSAQRQESAASPADAGVDAVAPVNAALPEGTLRELPYAGTLGKAPVVLRLTRAGKQSSARFFESNSASNTLLTGTVEEGGAFTFEAQSGGTLRGGFTSESEISATWTKDDAPIPLRVTRVTQRSPQAAGAVRVRKTKLGNGKPTSDPEHCSALVQVIEFVAALEPNAEAELNRRLNADAPPPECKIGVFSYFVETIVLKRRDLFSVHASSVDWGVSAPHGVASDAWYTFTLPSGEMLTTDAVFLPGHRERLLALIADQSAPEIRDRIPDLFSELHFGVEAKGLRFGPDQGWPTQGGEDEGLLLTYYELEKHRLLRPASIISPLVDAALDAEAAQDP